MSGRGDEVDSALPEQPVVRVMGDVEVLHNVGAIALQPGQRQLLALLVAVGPAGATSDRLADEIWGERLPKNWPNSLRVAVHRLRKRASLPIVSDGGRYRLDLPTESVDAWLLLDIVDRDVGWHPSQEELLASPRSFPFIEPSLAILEAGNAIAVAQRHLIDRLAVLEAVHGRPFLGRLTAHAAEDPTDDRLIESVATILAASGSSSEALGLIERCRSERLRVFDAEIGESLVTLEERIRGRAEPADEAVPAPTPIPSLRPLPVQLERYHCHHLVGRASVICGVLDRLSGDGTPTVVITGPAGIGKTALLAEVAHQTTAASHILFLGGTDTNTIAMSPLMAAVPGFAGQVDLEAKLGDPDGRRSRLAHRLIELVAAQAASRSTLLVIDDAHWLDSQTCELLDHLLRTEIGQSLAGVVVAVRSGIDGTRPWQAIEATLDRLTDVDIVDLEPLTVDEVEQMLARLEPELSLTARHQKALWLHGASGGLPEVVRRMVKSGATPSDATDDGSRVFDRIITSLDPEARNAGIAGAVMGRRFRLSDLAELLGWTDDAVADRLEILIERELVIEAGSFDHFEFRHQLVVDAFIRSCSRSRLSRLHQRACALTNDTHSISRHRVASASMNDPQVTLDAVLRSAEQYLADGAYWESASEFRTAIGLDGTELSPSAYVGYATALSLSGSQRASRSVRERAYAAAVAAETWDLAVDAAVSGLPQAELPDGEVDRLDQLDGVSAELLSPGHRLIQALRASRLAAQLGRVEQARHWASRATATAGSDEERGEAALATRFVQMVDPAQVRLAELDDAVDQLVLSPSVRCRLRQFRAVDHLEIGDYEQSVVEHERFSQLADTIDDPLRQWHALVFGSLLADLRGCFTTADQLADAAQERGRREAISQAEIVRVAQQYFRLEALGQLDELVDLIGLIPVSDTESTLFNAATARVLLAAGRRTEAIELAGELAAQLLPNPTVTSHGSIALLAPALAGHESKELRQRARAALGPHQGGGMVIGVGLGYIPSIDSLSMLLDDESVDGRIAALEQAIRDCDAAGLTTWSVRYRLDLAALTKSGDLAGRAEELAAGTDLVALLTGDGVAA